LEDEGSKETRDLRVGSRENRVRAFFDYGFNLRS